LEAITSGEIAIDGKVVNRLEPADRDIAMVFQNYALYPHMTVYKNMAYGLRIRRMPKAEIDERVRNAAKILELTEFLDRKPRQLSGGQRQRVAMGRCIVREPKVFLFDEPLSNLDAKLRVQMRLEIRNLHEDLKITSIYVTHDQVEAMTLAKRIVVMNAGKIEQIGSPQDMYERPLCGFVAGFIGSPSMNFIACRLIDATRRLAVQFGDGSTLPLPAANTRDYRAFVGRDMILGIRPEHCVEYRPHSEDSDLADLAVRVDVIEPLGMDTMIHFEFAGKQICSRVDPYAVGDVGETIRLMMDMNRIHLIDPATDKVVKSDSK